MGLGVVAYLRWRTFQDVPSGVDAGNWLAFGHGILGTSVRSSSIVYPPLVPLLSVAATWALGLTDGLRLLAVVSAAFPAFAVYLALRSAAGRWWGAGSALLFGAAGSIGEAVGFGGYPQLLGFGFLVLFAMAFDAFLSTRRWQVAAGAAGLLAGALASSDLIGGATVLAGLIVFVLHLLADRRRRLDWRTLLPGVAVMGVVVAAFAPLYLTMVHSLLQSQGVNGTSFSFDVLGQSLDTLYAEWPGLWRVLFALALAAPLLFIVQRRTFLWRLLVSLDVVTLVGLLAIREFRFVYLLPLDGVLSLGLVAAALAGATRELWRYVGQGLVLALAGSVVVELVSASAEFSTQIAFYTVLTPNMVSALDWVRAHAPPNAVIAVSTTQHEFPLGWWVEGYAERPAVYDADPTLLIYSDERRRVAEATTVFASGTGLSRAQQIAFNLGASFLLVDKSWSGYADWASSDPPRQGAPGIIVNDQSVLLAATKP